MWRRRASLQHNALPLTIALLVLAAWALRAPGLFAGSMHADEALFATWARLIGTWRDPLLKAELVDKPPLLFYLQALCYPLLGSAAPWVSRLPNLAASTLVTPLAARLVWNLYGDWLATVLAATIVTFSPLLVRFSATGFTDPLLAALLLAALVVASVGSRSPRTTRQQSGHGALSGKNEGRRGLAMGLLLGLAIATKYQAVLFVPLQVGIAAMNGARRRTWRKWLAGIALPLLGVAAWQAARGVEGSIWTQQLASFGGLRLSWSWELWPRIEAWAALWSTIIGSPVAAFGLLLFTPVFLAMLIQYQDRTTALDQLFLLFLLAYGLLHWFVAVPVWDRYLVAAAPLAAVVLGRFAARVLAFVQPALPLPARLVAIGLALALVVMMTPGGVAARDMASGGERHPQAAQGAAQIAADLQQAPYGTVLYDHWYSWYWRYFLLDSGVYVSWFAHPAALVEDLYVFLDEGETRYVALPEGEEAAPVVRALRGAGYVLETVTSRAGVSLYRIGQ
ncbi:MAG TPA: glycosyltransferase family 39 protein [Candidatus Binatia bacterium]|nr:glycosyltransferase family 39 protein [Candidatus Binatia bacterium]